MSKITLSGYELSLLDRAKAYVQLIMETENRYPSRDMLRGHLNCGSAVARNLQLYLMEFYVDTAEEEPERVEKESQTFKGDIWEISIPKTDIHTEAQLVDYMKIDLQKWEIVECTFNKWSMGTAGGGQQMLFQVKARCKLRRNIVDAINEIESLKEVAKAQALAPVMVYPERPKTGNLLEINIPDAHLGKLAWSLETGYENYDLKIAEAGYRKAFTALLSRASHYEFDRILFVTGNDLLQSDNMQSQTTRGTFVSTDGRYHKAFYKAKVMLIDCIEEARKFAPVTVVSVSGNHDELSAWHLADSLESYFHKYPDVEVMNEPTARKYYEWGQNMWMFTHGDKAKKDDYPLLMAAEKPQMFGRTKFREVHCGHTHETKTLEKHGIRVRVLPALCPPDEWHSANGYVGNLRNAEAYIYNDKEGLIGMAIYNAQSDSENA
jgi:hypothetical protein